MYEDMYKNRVNIKIEVRVHFASVRSLSRTSYENREKFICDEEIISLFNHIYLIKFAIIRLDSR